MTNAEESRKMTATVALAKICSQLGDRDKLPEGTATKVAFEPIEAAVNGRAVTLELPRGELVIGASKETASNKAVDTTALVASLLGAMSKSARRRYVVEAVQLHLTKKGLPACDPECLVDAKHLLTSLRSFVTATKRGDLTFKVHEAA